MNCESSANAVLVSLPISFVEAILSVRTLLDDDVASALGKSLAGSRPADRPMLERHSSLAVLVRGKYPAEFLGVRFAANTLPALFGQVVDMMADVAPEALISLARIRTHRRRLIALSPLHIHPHSPPLQVLQTASGWWISKNISQDQLMLALRRTCEVSGLTYGTDIKFPLR